MNIAQTFLILALTAAAFVLGAPITIGNLTFVSPTSSYSITYGQPVELLVSDGSSLDKALINDHDNLLKSTNSPDVLYTAYFSCATSSFQITGLSLGTIYSIVPGGVYGSVVITVTAENYNPATVAISIVKPSANIPPAFIPGRMAYYPSVYATMKEDKTVQIVSMEEFINAKENHSGKK